MKLPWATKYSVHTNTFKKKKKKEGQDTLSLPMSLRAQQQEFKTKISQSLQLSWAQMCSLQNQRTRSQAANNPDYIDMLLPKRQ